MDLLQQLSELEIAAYELEERKKDLMARIKTMVLEHGEMKAHGYVAYIAPGRKSTDHEAAAKFAGVPQELIDKHSTTKVTVKWAEVTKEGRIHTEAFTTVGKPTFTIKFVK